MRVLMIVVVCVTVCRGGRFRDAGLTPSMSRLPGSRSQPRLPGSWSLPRLPGRGTYRPVILVDGIFADIRDFDLLIQFIQAAHPGTNVTTITAFDTFMSSFKPLWHQTQVIKKQVSQIMREHPEGVHMLCFSQGGLVCRALLETMPDHNCHSFIALSSPLAGQYGDTDYLRYFFPGYIKSEMYRIFYTKFFQKELSIANYWNDPHQPELYRKYCDFLPVINNQTNNPHSHDYKKNLLRIRRLVAIGGPDDGVITPWQSAHLGFYDQNEKVVPYNRQQWYLEDWFGLRTLEERSDYHTFTVPGVEHIHWHRNKTVFDNYIVQWLD